MDLKHAVDIVLRDAREEVDESVPDSEVISILRGNNGANRPAAAILAMLTGSRDLAEAFEMVFAATDVELARVLEQR